MELTKHTKQATPDEAKVMANSPVPLESSSTRVVKSTPQPNPMVPAVLPANTCWLLANATPLTTPLTLCSVKK